MSQDNIGQVVPGDLGDIPYSSTVPGMLVGGFRSVKPMQTAIHIKRQTPVGEARVARNLNSHRLARSTHTRGRVFLLIKIGDLLDDVRSTQSLLRWHLPDVRRPGTKRHAHSHQFLEEAQTLAHVLQIVCRRGPDRLGMLVRREHKRIVLEETIARVQQDLPQVRPQGGGG